MSRQFEAKVWSPWSAVQGKEYGTVHFANRILTPTFLCEDVQPIVSPYNQGRAVKSLIEDGTHKYIQDNEIGMYEHIQSGKTNK